MDRIINSVASNVTRAAGTATFYQDNQVISVTLSQLDDLAQKVAGRLRALGVSAGDRIGIISQNRIEWVLLDLAAIKAKVVTAGFDYTSVLPGPDLRARYDLKVIFTDQATDLEGYIDVRAIMPVAEESAPSPIEVAYADDDATTIKFTSGSTGQPKGLAATVGSIDSSISAAQGLFHHGSGDKLFVFLPLSLLQQRYWIYSALHYGHDIVVVSYEFAFYAIKREQPTVIMGVPSFFDTLKQQIEVKTTALQARADVDGGLAQALRQCAAQALGGRVRYLWTGSAPAKPETLRFFQECGAAIYEGYGMNETCIVSKNHPQANRVGSVGKVVDGKQVFFDDLGVLIVRSRHPVNTRYLYCGENESEKVFLKNGDVRTGDSGYLDQDGYLFITGRYDDVIAMGNGKNVFVRPIEDRIKQAHMVAECVLFGAGRPYLVAVISPAVVNFDQDDLAAHIAEVNRSLGKHERIGNFIVANEPFSVGNGLLTTQYKPRRVKIMSEYQERINGLYGGA